MCARCKLLIGCVVVFKMMETQIPRSAISVCPPVGFVARPTTSGARGVNRSDIYFSHLPFFSLLATTCCLGVVLNPAFLSCMEG